MSVAYRYAQAVEIVVQLAVVGTEIYQPCAFLLYERFYGIVVVALVLAADNEYCRCLHAFQCIPAGIDICGLRVVDVFHACHLGDLFQTVLDTGEVAEALPDDLFPDASNVGCDTGGKRVVDIVLARQRELLLFHVEGHRLLNGVFAFLDISDRAFLLQL